MTTEAAVAQDNDDNNDGSGVGGDDDDEEGSLIEDEVKDLHNFVSCIEEYLKLLPDKHSNVLKVAPGTQPTLRTVESSIGHEIRATQALREKRRTDKVC